MRILRITRLLKMVKQRDLWMLVFGIVASMQSFFWAMLILTGYFYVTAIFLRSVLESEGEGLLDSTTRPYFSDVPGVMWFLFGSMTDGLSWGEFTEPICQKSKIFYFYF